MTAFPPVDWPFDQPPDCVAITTTQVLKGGEDITHVYHDEDDHGWQFHYGGEKSSADAMVVAMKTIVAFDPSVFEVADLPVGWVAVRERRGSPWRRSKNECSKGPTRRQSQRPRPAQSRLSRLVCRPRSWLIFDVSQKKMIDSAARESLAENLRQLASGAITNFAFEEHRCSRIDPAVHEIAECLAWPHYDDFSEHRLDGDYALTDGRRKDFARAVLFLKSDFEYRWPKRSGLVGWGGYFRRVFTFWLAKPKVIGGDVRYWPFWSEDDYRDALKRAPYLCGHEKTG